MTDFINFVLNYDLHVILATLLINLGVYAAVKKLIKHAEEKCTLYFLASRRNFCCQKISVIRTETFSSDSEETPKS